MTKINFSLSRNDKINKSNVCRPEVMTAFDYDRVRVKTTAKVHGRKKSHWHPISAQSIWCVPIESHNTRLKGKFRVQRAW